MLSTSQMIVLEKQPVYTDINTFRYNVGPQQEA